MKTSRFAQYAAEGSKRMFVGTLIKCVKDEWQMGPDRDLISPTTRFVAVMSTLTVGHLKWVDNRQVDSRIGLVADGFRRAQRDELGDLDQKNWEADEYGDRKDPWQPTDLLVLVAPAPPHDLYTFSTSSVGGANALADLCGAHACTTEGVGQYPVVTLATGSYVHKIKSRGRIFFPVFKIVDSVEAAPFNALVAEARGGAGFIPTSPPALEGPIAAAIAHQAPKPPMPPMPPLPSDDGPPADPEDPGAEPSDGPQGAADDDREYLPF